MRWRWPFGGRAEPEPGAGGERAGRDEVVLLTTAPNEPMARYWADALAEAGVRTMVRAGGAGVGGWGSAATLEHELHVLRSQLAEAQAILLDLEADGDGEP
jgi:hypothetical protein